MVVGMDCLGWDHFEVWRAPGPYLNGVDSQILSHIYGMRSKTGIETWPRVVSGTYRKICSQGYP